MKQVPSLSEQIKRGIQDVENLNNGKLTFKSYKASLPKEDFSPDELRSIREDELHVSQKVLADGLGISVRTLQGWEIGRSKPIGPATRLIRLIREVPSVRKKLFSVS
jgi:putative transcriptional regulator